MTWSSIGPVTPFLQTCHIAISGAWNESPGWQGPHADTNLIDVAANIPGEIRDQLGLLARDRVFGPRSGSLGIRQVANDRAYVTEHDRLRHEFIRIRPGFGTDEEAYVRLRDREVPNGASMLLALRGEFPPDLWRERKDGSIVPLPGEFVKLLTERGEFASPRDTFTGAGFELLRYECGVYEEGARAFIHSYVERAHQSRGLTARSGFTDEVARGVARRSLLDRRLLNPPGLLNLENGVFDLEGRTLRPHSAGLRFTQKLQVRFETNAACPLFLKFLSEILPREKDRREIQKLFGYCLMAGNPYQVAHLFYGDGNNGKSTLISVLIAFLGRNNVSAETLQSLNENRFSSAKLYGKLLNAFADLPSNPLKVSSTFKTLTGGDEVRAELKFGAIFYFVNSAKLVFSANEFPEVNERTRAFWRRWRMIRFEQDLTGREDRTLLPKLLAELPGILNWALQGVTILAREDGFTEDLGAEDRKAEWVRRSDTLAWFVSEGVEVDPSGWVPKDDFYESYADFCAANRAPTKSPEVVGRDLPRHRPGVRTEKRRLGGGEGQVRGWRGIRIRWVAPASPVPPVPGGSTYSQGNDRESTLGTGEASEPGASHLSPDTTSDPEDLIGEGPTRTDRLRKVLGEPRSSEDAEE